MTLINDQNPPPPFRRRTDPAHLAGLMGLLFTVVVAIGGWLYNMGMVRARFENQEERIRAIELTYVPASIHSERDKARDLQNQELRDANTQLRNELAHIEAKLDQVIAYQNDRRH